MTVKSYRSWKPKQPIFNANWRFLKWPKMNSETKTFAFIVLKGPKNHVLKKEIFSTPYSWMILEG